MDRLEAIFSVIPECGVLADVGCDHGKLTRRVALSGKAKKVIATDISQSCLNKAMELNADLDNVEYGVGDGLKALQGKRCDVIVLSGMGGNTMMSILSDLPDATLVLQPQSDVPALRGFLVDNGYRIVRDFVIFDDGFYYDVMLVQKGEMVLDDVQRLFGAYYKEHNADLKSKLEILVKKLKTYKATDKNLYIINSATEALRWQE